MGIVDVALKDSMLFVSTSGSGHPIHLFAYPSLVGKGGFLHKGNGPGELLYTVFWGYARFHVRGDSLLVDIPNGNKNILVWNASAACRSGETVVYGVPVEIPGTANYRFVLNDSTLFCRTLSDDQSRLRREIYISGRRVDMPCLAALNEVPVSIRDGYSFNLLSGVPVYNDSLGVVADACLAANVINYFSLDSKSRKSVVIGRKAVTVDKAEASLRLARGMMRQFFLYGVSDADGCAFLYHDSKYKILLLNWSGEPQEEVVLPHPASTFCLDRKRGIIWALDAREDALYKHTLAS